MNRLLAPFVLALASTIGWSQSAPISGQVINTSGQPLPNATVRVCAVTSMGTPCTPLATIYSDYGLTQQAPNPYPADQYGNYLFYVGAISAPNAYLVQITPAGGVTWSYAFNGPYLSLAGGTIAGSITAQAFSGPLNGTVGATTPSTGAFTTATASGGFTGNLTGNVTGILTGSVVGNVTGNLTGNMTGTVTGHATLDLPAAGGTLTGTVTGTSALMFSIAGTGTPTFSIGPAAGVGATVPACPFGVCDSLHGSVQFTTGTATTGSGVLLTITTGSAYLSAPICVAQVRLSNSPWTLVDSYLNYTSVPAQIIFNMTGTALTASTAYTASYTACTGQ